MVLASDELKRALLIDAAKADAQAKTRGERKAAPPAVGSRAKSEGSGSNRRAPGAYDPRRAQMEARKKPNGSAPASVAPSMAQGGPSAPAKPLAHPSSKSKPAQLASTDIMPAKPPMHPKGEKKPEPKKAAPAKKPAKKDHSGDPRYTTPPFVAKQDQPPAPKKENRAEKVARLNAKSKSMNAEHRASKPGRPAAPSDSTGKDWMKRRGVKTDRR